MSETATEKSMVLVGLMSGTSLDGITAAVVRFNENADGRVSSELLAFVVRDYTVDQHDRLARALSGGSPEEYCRLNFDLSLIHISEPTRRTPNSYAVFVL